MFLATLVLMSFAERIFQISVGASKFRSLLSGNRQPRIHFKLYQPNKETKDMLEWVQLLISKFSIQEIRSLLEILLVCLRTGYSFNISKHIENILWEQNQIKYLFFWKWNFWSKNETFSLDLTTQHAPGPPLPQLDNVALPLAVPLAACGRPFARSQGRQFQWTAA